MAQLQRSLVGGGEPGVDTEAAFERIELAPGSWVEIARGWLRGADTLLEHVVEHVPWTQGRRWMIRLHLWPAVPTLSLAALKSLPARWATPTAMVCAPM